uniref:Retrotransposon protein, putative, Ty3-gypsy subclass n=1 Tax=Oryza sativa subsp. japonica TaxID=39947 RepID=Q2QQQ1_ORYSJ|nr:retrotransposon protein, putative, Ty3-gypsy subclass [Oryza sativa Japonica Group]
MSVHGNMSWGCVLWVQLYTSDQSKTIQIAMPTVMGGKNLGRSLKRDLSNQIADHPPNHRGEGMDDFVAELARMTLVVSYPNAPEYSTVPPLSGEFPHRVRLEVHGYVGTCLANMVVEASGGTADHACQEAAYLMMARLRERHNYIFCNTAYRFHPRQASGDDVNTFRPIAGENDTTFGHMCAASKALNDGKLVRIIALKDKIARLKKENAQLKGLPIPGGVRVSNTSRKSTTSPVRIQLAPRNPHPPAVPAAHAVPAVPAALAPAPAPAPVSAPASALSFAPASAVRGPTGGNGGWLPATPSGSRDHSSSSSSGTEPGSGETYLPDSRSRSEGPGDEQEDAFDSTDCRSRSEH